MLFRRAVQGARSLAYRGLLNSSADRDLWGYQAQLIVFDWLLGGSIEEEVLSAARSGFDTPSDSVASYDPMDREEPEEGAAGGSRAHLGGED